MLGALRRVDSWLARLAAALVVAGIGVMLFLALTTIVARWFGMSFSWLEPLVRHLVLLTAFLGGVLATGEGSHINIDLFSRFLGKGKGAKTLRVILSAFTCGVLTWLTWASTQLAAIEWQFGKEVFFGIHSGLLVGIIPFGLALMGFRFFVIFINALCDLRAWNP